MFNKPSACLTCLHLHPYYAGMKSIQYTIRKIPEELDQKLRIASRNTSKSLNTLIIETLEKKFVHPEGKPKYRDLSHLSGRWEEDPEFDHAMDLFDEIDYSAWK